MKSFKNTLLIAATAVVVLFASCKKSVPKQTQYIPKDASFVFAANAKNLHDKLDKSKISVDSLIRTVLAENNAAPDDIKQWNDLKDAGIKWQSEVFVYMLNKGSVMGGQNVLIGVVAAMDDAAKFEAYFKKKQPGADIKTASNYSYAAATGGFSVGWNKDVVVVVNVTGNRFSNNGQVNNAEAQLASVFAQKEAESVAGIPEFRQLTAEKADMLVWTNSTASLAAIPMLGLTKAADLFKDTYNAGTVNFEDGKITASYTSHFGKALTDIIKKYQFSPFDQAALKQYPSNQIDGFFAFAFKTEILLDIINYIGVDAMANQYLAQMGFTLEDIVKVFKGDMLGVFSDFSIQEKANPIYPQYKSKVPEFKFIFNAAIGDKAAFNKVAGALAQKGILLKQGNQYLPAMSLGTYKVTLDEKNLFIASDSTVLQQYKAGTAKAGISDDVKGKIKGKTAAFYVDINKILGGIPADSASAAVMTEAKASFKDLVATSDSKIDGNKMKGYFELRTGNEKENSLATIIKFIKVVADHEKSRRDKLKVEDITLEDTVAAPEGVEALDPPAPPKK